ncbi:MAG: hypothetical protein GX847_10875, partial [Clostridiales bacterium]|nr:hypothetical protein [Clostridiales bacterium]
NKTGRLLVLEECAEAGCVGEKIAAYLAQNAVTLSSLKLLNLGSRFIPQGSVDELRSMCGIDTHGVVQAATEACETINSEATPFKDADAAPEDADAAPEDADAADDSEDLDDADDTNDSDDVMGISVSSRLNGGEEDTL